MLASADARFQERMRRKTRRCLDDEDRIQEARRAAQFASEKVLRATSYPNKNSNHKVACAAAGDGGANFFNNTAASVFPRMPSFDMSVDSSVALSAADDVLLDELPSERAVRRGLRRGSREINDTEFPGFEEDFPDYVGSDFGDITTITDAVTDHTTKESKKNKKKKKNDHKNKGKFGQRWKIQKKGNSGGGGGGDNVGDSARECDAWMCGVCGKAFSSLQSAEKHEDWHLREVITGLGWAGENTAFNNMGYLHIPSSNNNNHHNNEDIFYSQTNRPVRSRTNSDDSFFGNRRASSSRDLPTAFRPRGTAGSEDQGDPFYSAARFQSPFPAAGDDNRKPPAKPGVLVTTDFGNNPLVPKPRARTLSEVRFEESPLNGDDDILYGKPKGDVVLIPNAMRNYVVLSDEALIAVCQRAKPMILTKDELKAERELAFLARDKAYYDECAVRALARRANPSNRFRSEGDTVAGKVQNKMLDAYQLMKEGDNTRGMTDQYTKKKTSDGGAANQEMIQNEKTLYVNVMVKNSQQVLRNELERLARERWRERPEEAENFTRFQAFREYAHLNIVKLAGIALAGDFTPRRIAIQLSNDIYRLLTPKLKRRGVTIAIEIEYRVGGYFVLAVNINTIEWTRLLKMSKRDLLARQAKWDKDQERDESDENQPEKKKRVFKEWLEYCKRVFSLTQYDIVAHCFALLYTFHWLIYLPVCTLSYRSPLGHLIRRFIVASAIDEICYYVESKGMETETAVCSASSQAGFMLSALREIRAGDRELKKKQQETEQVGAGRILGPLLGPAIKDDKGPASPPPGFELPTHLEYLALDLELPVGFRRLRWGMLNRGSSFIVEAFWRAAAKNENITMGKWSKHDEHIGSTKLPPIVNPEDFIGAERESSYLMPKSAFVSANMVYETVQITEYTEHCFCLFTRTRTPDVPFGGTFVALTRHVVVNTGNNSCRMYCSVEAEFPNGPPMVARQIQSGMRAGTTESFFLTAETITKYANVYP